MFTAGTFADSSRTMKGASAKTAMTKQPAMSGESNQSSRCPSSSAYCSEQSPTLRRDARASPCSSAVSAAAQVRGADVLGLVDEARDHEEREDADGDVDVEDPGPAVVVDDVAAERRAERRADHDRHGEDGHRHPLLLGRERLAEDGLLGRLEGAGAEALHDAERDERRQRCAPCRRAPSR